MKAPPKPAAPTKADVEALIGRIGEVHREMTALGVDYGSQAADLKKTYEGLLEPLRQEAESAERKVRDWCEAHRTEICAPRSKTAKFATGVVRWKKGRSKIVIADVEKVLQRLKSLGLTRFIREKQEINLQALAAEPAIAETITGVSIVPAVEEISIEPVRV